VGCVEGFEGGSEVSGVLLEFVGSRVGVRFLPEIVSGLRVSL